MAGEIDLLTAAELERRMLAAVPQHCTAPRLLVDVSEVSFLSAAGLTVLLHVQDRMRALGGGLRLLRPGPHLLRVLRIAGLEAELPVTPA